MNVSKNIFKTFLLVILSSLLVVNSSADDFTLDVLPQADKPNFILSDMIGQTYHDVVYNYMAAAIAAEGKVKGGDTETKLKAGGGVSVYLAPNIYNIHINFRESEKGGRSYGWTSGKVGDWTDSMYLNNLEEISKHSTEKEMTDFYKVIVNILGTSDASGLSRLEPAAIRVATNYLAIHTAEQYRRVQKPSTRWDDALLQVTLLAAFHGGQEKFQMFYMGDFTDSVRKKKAGVYANGKEGKLFHSARIVTANLEAYHQHSFDPKSKRSGINLTRKDFEKMGEVLTEYFESNGSENFEQIKKILGIQGATKNIISEIAKYYCEGIAKPEDTKAMAEALSGFMLENRKLANKISNVVAEKTRSSFNSCRRYYAH